MGKLIGGLTAGSNPAKGTKKYHKMKKHTKEQVIKENQAAMQLNPEYQKQIAKEVLKRAKEMDAEKIASGKKWVRIDHRTEVLR